MKDVVSAAATLMDRGVIAAVKDFTTILLAKVTWFNINEPNSVENNLVLDCNCDPAGVVEAFAGCGSVPKGELCKCKERVQGRICNQCKPLYWNMQTNNPLGCQGITLDILYPTVD